MQNDSLETLLLRHYGHTAPIPADLAERLQTSLRQTTFAQQGAGSWQERRMGRRNAVRLVALGSAGLGVLGVGLEALETVLGNPSVQQSATP